jgi:NitT/TauT family transport system substrate-binding protein
MIALRMLFAAAMLLASPAMAQTKITFGTDWLAEAEHGGFYQAVALGLYKKHGLDVTIRMGGPGVNPTQLVAAGVTDFQMSSGSFAALNMVQQGVPVLAVAAFFQKDPQVLISHPGAGNDTLADMKGKPILISASARSGYWLFLKAKFGFTDDQIRPYNFSMAPFLADKSAIQQGFVSSEPYQIERQGSEKPLVHLLADNGYASYSNLVLTTTEMTEKHPEIVKAFIEASIEGWYSYLYGNPEPGNALIRAANKDMTPDTIEHAIALLKQYGIADSGDSLTLGLGAMAPERWQSFFETMSSAGLYKPDLDWHKAFTTAFVNQKYGLELKPK